MPGRRWYQPLDLEGLDDDEPVSAWLITWAPGTGLDLHDHGGSAGSLAVVGGELTEWHATTADVAGPGKPRLQRRRLTDGSVTTFGPDHVHAVRNDGLEPAVSIHIYVPGLAEMAFYDAPAADRPGIATRTAHPMDQPMENL
jgi:predicted metal-dependent enzyme (double-stranded beta helix superfamily)